MTASRKFAVFDIDGTLIRWQLYHAVFDQMAKQGHIPAEDYQRVRDLRMKWKLRESADAYQQYEKEMIAVYERLLPTFSVDSFQSVAKTVTDIYKGQAYTYTRSLIGRLKSEGYVLIAISGSHQDLLDFIAPEYGFDVWVGSTYEHKDGHYTGERFIAGFSKQQILENLIMEHHLTTTDSYAVGDSASDIPMLALTDHPIAFNPNQALLKAARQHNWTIVIERKDVVYQIDNVDSDNPSVAIVS